MSSTTSTYTPKIFTSKAESADCSKNMDISKKATALDSQVGGDHYKRFPIQPIEFCYKNGLDNCQSEVISYVVRHKFKNGKTDLLKARHTLDIYIEMVYGNDDT